MVSHPQNPGANSAAQFLPDYGGGSILNAVASIAQAFGVDTGHTPARLLPPGWLRRSHLILLVVDGLGYSHLEQATGADTLRSLRRGQLTSVFPSTTATAITTYLTGLSPAEHALTGWHVYLREIGLVGAVLPFRVRGRESPLRARGLAPEKLYDHASLASRLPATSFAVSPESILRSEYNVAHTRGAARTGYTSQGQMFQALHDCLAAPGERKFIYAYYPVLDSVAHEQGIGSAKAAEVLRTLDRSLAAFLDKARGSDATLVICADHGFIDIPAQGNLELQHLPHLQAMLRAPLCGERRVPFCYVKPGLEEAFLRQAQSDLEGRATVRPSTSLLEEGWFGPGTAHPELRFRVGDFILVMHPGYTFKDWTPGEKRHRLVGVHGGVSADEMLVPLLSAEL